MHENSRDGIEGEMSDSSSEIPDSDSDSDSRQHPKSLIPIPIPGQSGIIPESIPIPESESCITGRVIPM